MEKSNILVVDDDSGPREALRMILKDKYKLAFAEDGLAALNYLQKNKPDLILMDLKMPKMNGIETLKEIKKNDPTIEVLILTGFASLDSALQAIKFGAYEYITKPFDKNELITLIEKGLSRRRNSLETKRTLHQLKELSDSMEAKQMELAMELINQAKLASIGRLAQGIAHNMNSPLAGIMGKAELLKLNLSKIKKESDSSEDAYQNKWWQEFSPIYKKLTDDAEAIIAYSDKLSQIISSLMDKSRQEQTAKTQDLDLNELLKSELRFQEADMNFKYKIEKTYNFAPSLPLIKGLYSDFSQSFVNIIGNAIEAMYWSKTRRLTVSTSYDDEYIYVFINDTGPGIKEEDKVRLFEPFFSTKPMKSTNGSPVGVGLGLYSSYVMLNAYGAIFKVESEPGNTTFKIQIPYKQSG